jgi:hypothetical protein
MVYNSSICNCVPPRLAVRLLELILPPQAADNEIGDLIEEFCLRVHKNGLRNTRRWFWLQAFSTLWISIREGWVVHLVFWESTRWRLIAFSLAVIAVLMFYLLSLQYTYLHRELAQIQAPSNYFELAVLPPTPSRSDASRTYKNNRPKMGEKLSVVSVQNSLTMEKSNDDRTPLSPKLATETAGPVSPTYSGYSGTLYPFCEPGMNIKNTPPQTASVSSIQAVGCFQ